MLKSLIATVEDIYKSATLQNIYTGIIILVINLNRNKHVFSFRFWTSQVDSVKNRERSYFTNQVRV